MDPQDQSIVNSNEISVRQINAEAEGPSIPSVPSISSGSTISADSTNDGTDRRDDVVAFTKEDYAVVGEKLLQMRQTHLPTIIQWICDNEIDGKKLPTITLSQLMDDPKLSSVPQVCLVNIFLEIQQLLQSQKAVQNDC